MRKIWLSTAIIVTSTYHSGYAAARRQTAFVPCSSAEHELFQRRKNCERKRHKTLRSRDILFTCPSPTAYCRYNALMNTHTKEKEDYSETTLDVLIEENVDTITSSLTTETNSPAEISLLGVPLRSIILLNLVAIIWGTQHSVIKTVVDDSALFSIGFGHDLGITSWAEHVFGANWELFTSNLQISNHIANDAGGNRDDAAAYFTLARFSLAALLASPYTPGLKRSTIDEEYGGSALALSQSNIPDNTAATNEQSKLAWKYGIELGIYMFLGYGFQAIGLQTTTASRSGFLLYLNVKLVPFFSFFLFGKTIQTSTWISALVAFAGTALLAFDNASNGEGGLVDASFAVGDLWSIAAAAASALFILRMETASKAVPKSAELNAANLWTVAFLSLVWTAWISFNNLHTDASLLTQTLPETLVQTIQLTFQQTVNTITSNPLQLIYLSAVTTALANYLQSIAQKEVSAERATIFYALDPVYGAAFANLLLGETLGLYGWFGASLIAFAAATNAIWDFSTTEEEVE
mmetsp:Transcript_5709/g.9614  ORF Transcript_5709/g.9614 Transcript_5709/m.9614 type:complete len:522 (+) Transcript_5709:45-1610(+)